MSRQSKTLATLTFVAAVTGLVGMVAWIIGTVVWAFHGGR